MLSGQEISRNMIESGLDKNDILDSLGFRAENTKTRRRPSTSENIENAYQKKRAATKPLPEFEVHKCR